LSCGKLVLFVDPSVLRQTGRPLLKEFFERFTPLLPSRYFLPNPRADNEAYFDSLASVLERTGELPDGLRKALFEVETLAEMSRNGGKRAPMMEMAGLGRQFGPGWILIR